MDKRKHIIYMYTLISDGRVYIGQTVNTPQQRAGYNGNGYKECSKFYNAIQKYGWENFELTILRENVSSDEVDFWEQYYIQLYDSQNTGFNITGGGQQHHTISPETKDKISNALKGRTLSEKHKQHLRESHLGERNVNYGKPRSIETRAKIGSANAISQLGKKATEETKKKMSFAHKQHIKILCVETGIIYDGPQEAGYAMGGKGKSPGGHITEVCKGKRKTAFGYHWKYLDKDTEEREK